MRYLAGLILFCSLSVYAAPMVQRVFDGDTVEIIDQTQRYHLRINDIDAPERNQAYGKKSRRTLLNLCRHAEIQISLTGTDRYQRRLGKLSCNQEDVSYYMVKHGYAWFYAHYSNDATLATAERMARQQHLGLWQAEHPLPPWIWRKMAAKMHEQGDTK